MTHSALSRPVIRRHFKAAGTPKQQERWRKRASKSLREAAQFARKTALRFELIAERLEAISSLEGSHAEKLIDEVQFATSSGNHGAFGNMARRAMRASYQICMLVPEVQETQRPTETTVRPLAANFAITEAEAIVKSSVGIPDWTREPVTERERKVRRALLRGAVEKASRPLDIWWCRFADIGIKPQDGWLGMKAADYDEFPSDVREAVAEAYAVSRQQHDEHELAKFSDAVQDALDEIDGIERDDVDEEDDD